MSGKELIAVFGFGLGGLTMAWESECLIYCDIIAYIKVWKE